jgi:hypothetical protein
MAINKNFVVKNGLEVKSNLLVADSDTNRVGVGTTVANHKLHVLGGIGATDVVVSSALTATTADIGSLSVNGIGITNLSVSGLSTFTGFVDANGGIDVTGHTELDTLNVSGVSTFVGVATFQGNLYVGGDLYVADDVFYDEISGRNISISGVGTLANLFATSGNISNLTSASIGSTNINITGVGTVATLNATIGTINYGSLTNLNVTGIGSIASLDVPTGTIDYLTSVNFESTGITTLASSGGITTTGGNLYVDQDLYFGGDLYQNGEIFTSGIGIQTGDTLIGSGVTFIEFRGPGVSTGYYDSSVGIATIFFQGGGGGGGSIGIGSTFPTSKSNGDLFYHIDYGRTFIYYDEAILGVGSSAFWVDSSPFNVGILTAEQPVAAGGTWSAYTAGIATSKSVGINTATLDDPDLTGIGNSFQGLYVSNGMMIFDNELNGNHYIGTSFNGLIAGPVTINGTLSVDGNYVVV